MLVALTSTKAKDFELNDQAQLARDAWRSSAGDEEGHLSTRLQASRGGRNLTRIGMSGDIQLAANVDAFDIAPHLDTVNWRIYVP